MLGGKAGRDVARNAKMTLLTEAARDDNNEIVDSSSCANPTSLFTAGINI